MRVAIIPARGGSRRIPRKNIRQFHGKPIIAYSIEAAKQSGLFDEIWVSTEDAGIARVAWDCGAKWHPRPAEYAQDAVGTQEVMRQCLRELQTKTWRPDYACCIYATCPMLLASDLLSGWDGLERTGVDYVYVPGWFYWGAARAFLQGVPLTSGAEIDTITESGRYIDINTEEDWHRAERMYAELHKEAA